MVSKFLRGKSTEIVVTGLIIAGLVFAATKLNLGKQIKEGAFGFGSSAGDVLTSPLTGLVSSLTQGLNDLQSTIPNFLETTGSIGADFQEFVTGNRNAIGTFFDDTPEISSKALTPASLGFELDPNVNERAAGVIAQNLFSNFGDSSQESVRQIAKDSSSDRSFISTISNIVNPKSSSPSTGIYNVTLPNGNPFITGLPLSQATINIYKNLGYKIQRVG